MCPRGRREFVTDRHFLVVVPQPIGFCNLMERANRSAWFVSPALFFGQFLARHFVIKMQLPFFPSFPTVMPKWKADEIGALGHQ